MLSQTELSRRLYADPAFTDLARLVGYLGIKYPIPKADYDRLIEKHGVDRMTKAAAELVDYDHEKKIAKLKLNVRVLCRMLLGPSPEEWDSFYEGIENPPPNPYRPKPEAKHDPPDGLGLLRELHGRRLRQLLLNEHLHLQQYPPDHEITVEAIRRCDLLETEMRRRKQKIPPRPDRQTAIQKREDRISELEGRELMQRIFKAREILFSESPQTGVYKQSQIELDLLEVEATRRNYHLPPAPRDLPPGPDPFRHKTTARLMELLDMNQIELTKYGRESVTFQEAARDIGSIERELLRRKSKVPATLSRDEPRARYKCPMRHPRSQG